MDKDSSLIEKKVIMVDRLIPTKFKKIKTFVATSYDLIYGKCIPIKFEKRIKYIPSEHKTIKIPLSIAI